MKKKWNLFYTHTHAHTHAHTQTHTLTHNHMKLTQSLLPPDIQQHLQKEYKLDEWKT